MIDGPTKPGALATRRLAPPDDDTIDVTVGVDLVPPTGAAFIFRTEQN